MILQIESYKRGIILSSAFNLISRLLLFGQSIVIAHYFSSEESDIFFFCFSTTVLLALFINGLDYTLIIPEWTRLSELGDSRTLAGKYVNSFLVYYIIAGILFFLMVSLFPISTLRFCSDFDSSTIERNSMLVRLFGPLLGLMILTSLMTNILVASKYFTLPSVLSATNSLLAIVSTVTLSSRLGVNSIVLGLVFSHLLNLVILILLLRTRLRWSFRLFDLWPKWDVMKGIVTAQLGHIASFSSAFVPLYLMSGLDKGVITAMIFGQRTAEIPSQLIINQFSVVVGIKFNELSLKAAKAEIRDIFLAAVDLLIYLTIPISLLGILLAPNLISLFYGSGGFTEEQVSIASKFLQVFVALLPLLAVNTLCIRLFMSARLLKEILFYQFVLNGILIGMTYLLVGLVGPLGYPIAYFTAYALITFCVGLILKLYFPSIGLWSSTKYFAKIMFINGLVLAITKFASRLLSWDQNIVEIIVVTSIYLAVLLAFTHVFALNRDINNVVSSLRARIRVW